MAVSPERARDLALSLDGTSEAPHFHRQAFRTTRKTFATLDAAVPDLNLMFDPDHQAHFCEQESNAFAPVPGGWGRMGSTRCDLAVVSEEMLSSALLAAWRLAAPKPRKR